MPDQQPVQGKDYSMSNKAIQLKPRTSNKRRLSDLILKQTGCNPNPSITPLEAFKVTIGTVEVCDFFLDMNILADTGGEYDTQRISNRAKKSVNLQRLEAVMAAGKWDPDNGETIKIAANENGQFVLADGQHRIQAIRNHLESGGDPITVTIMTGMSTRSILTMDTGANRSVSDFLVMVGGGAAAKGQYPNDVASAGRFAFRAAHNIDGHPLRKTDNNEGDGMIAEWLLESGMAKKLRKVRRDYDTVLKLISNKRESGNAGAKPHMTWLISEWVNLDQRLMIDALNYLGAAQSVDMPTWSNGKAQVHWKYARQYVVELIEEGQSFRGAAMNVMQRTLVAYAMAWNMSRGDSRHKNIRGADSFAAAVDSYFTSKTPVWPGLR
jgi:hypothetical protein